MVDPVTLTAITMASTIAAGGISAIGSNMSAEASANAFRYKAGIAGLNKTIAEQNAAWATNAGGIKASNFGLRAAQEIAETKVRQSGSGIDVTSGSSAAVRETQGDVARFEQGIIRADARHTAYGYEMDAQKATAEGSLDIASADNARKAGDLSVLSSIIGTAGSVASKWSQGNTIGIGSGSGSIGTYDPSNYGAAPTWS